MSFARLSGATLDRLPPGVVRPRYDRSVLRTGVVHLGIGAFHRAHQATYFDDLIGLGDPRWGVLGASLRSRRVRDALAPQDGLYTLVERSGPDEQLRIVGAVRSALVAPENPARLVQAMADPDVHLVTLSVTEKGYKLDPAGGALLLGDHDIAADLSERQAPRTAIGFLVASLAARRARGLMPFTVLSCDNLPNNGARVRAAVLAFAATVDPSLRDWIDGCGAFPSTMVDRIVPATTDADRNRLAATLGVEDRGMVKTEPFTQWVVEDWFAGERPPLEQVGVQMTGDVRPWEEAKLRLLNGAHSAIAYLGALSGAEFVHEAVAFADLKRYVERLWDEAQTTIAPSPSLDLAVYRTELMARFTNSALAHSTRQIAMDGSQKIPQRLLAPIADRLRQGASIDALALAVAAWMLWQRGVDEGGSPYVVDDPLAPATRAAWKAGGIGNVVDRMLMLTQVFPPDLSTNAVFRTTIARQLDRLMAHGAKAALSDIARQRALA
ncbi:MAG TPA: mannitol dehydrogenase family protein [Sphingomonadaceae bacterium]|nr:mannitol dehydrogenase family protein [Sphingomonadaceae bacterium]